jgi:hypothetical protein
MRFASMLIPACAVLVSCGGDLSGTNIPLCTSATAYTVGTSITGSVSESDCKDGEGNIGDVYSFTTGSQSSFVVNYSGSGFKPSILLYQGTIANSASSRIIADIGVSDFASFQAFLPAGAYYFVVTSENAAGGTYTFSTSSPATTNGCQRNMILRGQTFSGDITNNDCPGNGAARADMYNFYLKSGETVNASFTTNKGGALALRDDGNAAAADLITRQINVVTGGTASFTYTAVKNGWVFVAVYGEPSFSGTATKAVGINRF